METGFWATLYSLETATRIYVQKACAGLSKIKEWPCGIDEVCSALENERISDSDRRAVLCELERLGILRHRVPHRNVFDLRIGRNELREIAYAAVPSPVPVQKRRTPAPLSIRAHVRPPRTSSWQSKWHRALACLVLFEDQNDRRLPEALEAKFFAFWESQGDLLCPRDKEIIAPLLNSLRQKGYIVQHLRAWTLTPEGRILGRAELDKWKKSPAPPSSFD